MLIDQCSKYQSDVRDCNSLSSSFEVEGTASANPAAKAQAVALVAGPQGKTEYIIIRINQKSDK